MTTQTVIVTGAASGIGLACTKLLLAEGAQVTAFDIQGERMAELLPADDENLHQIAGDVSDPAVCEKVVAETLDQFGKLDALIHWGAAHSSARWDELGAEECTRTLEVNVTGSFLISQAAAKPMIKQGKGAIVLCTSTSVLHGVTGGEGQGGPAYVASKGAVIALMRSFARALGPEGIRVNAVSPGITETAMIESYSEEQRDNMKQRFPLGRFARPEEIAEGGIYLISDKASFMTGETMHINGGSNFG
ncbi:MAG: SDR family oxidoreductase [Rhodospirillaceae bacterium]|jgi:NAD(P)-dependent dehydrogenase (short-subunit alcohol dehydrogenase family)|nr:SDR family oxidoreductase [Rhodospirillaceae bacterium]MBT4589024.1 SDR family oxidoreductase [Rhodospirillaceae bacterium]MBT4939669.1 SDR family oxidoreductase [Rhodospirillaceae bacterium]MBT5941467.1 SDR family oxidoreductase [Rhodospirillaceae bacterium]